MPASPVGMAADTAAGATADDAAISRIPDIGITDFPLMPI
jgi:hypothetical protein